MYFVSFPKSGRTYLRFMVGKYFQLKNNLKEKHILNYAEDNGLIFTHAHSYEDYHNIDFSVLKKEHTIWLRRNPIDTLVSFFFHVKYRKKQYKSSIHDFIRSEQYGIQNFISFENKVKKLNHEMVLHYEDMCELPEVFLTSILKKLGENPIKDYVEWAIEESSFDKMREAEMSGRVSISEKDYIDKTDERQLKVRKGQIGKGINYLTKEDIKYVNKIMEIL